MPLVWEPQYDAETLSNSLKLYYCITSTLHRLTYICRKQWFDTQCLRVTIIMEDCDEENQLKFTWKFVCKCISAVSRCACFYLKHFNTNSAAWPQESFVMMQYYAQQNLETWKTWRFELYLSRSRNSLEFVVKSEKTWTKEQI